MSEDLKIGIGIFSSVAGVLIFVGLMIFAALKIHEYHDDKFIEICESAGGVVVPTNDGLICERD